MALDQPLFKFWTDARFVLASYILCAKWIAVTDKSGLLVFEGDPFSYFSRNDYSEKFCKAIVKAKEEDRISIRMTDEEQCPG